MFSHVRILMGQQVVHNHNVTRAWFYGEDRLPDRHRPRSDDLKQAHLKTAKARAMKDSLRDLWD